MNAPPIAYVLGAVVVGLVVVKSCTADPPPPQRPPPTPQEVAAEAKRTKQAAAVLAILRGLKATAKNPNSFEVTAVGVTDKGAICVQFRATNSFNAVVPGIWTQPPLGQAPGSDKPQAWNKWCKGQSAEDFTYVRTLL